MAVQHAIAVYRDVEGDVENSFVLLRDGKVYSIEEVVSQHLMRLRPSERIKTRIRVGNVNASAELAVQGKEKIADVFFDPDDVVAIVSIKRFDNNWLWDSATLRFSSLRGSIMYDKKKERDERRYLVEVSDTIYFVPEGDEEKKVAIVSDTYTVPLAVINRAINKITVEGRIGRELLEKLNKLRNEKDPPEAFPVEKLKEIEELLRKHDIEVYYNHCNLIHERYVNELPVNDIKRIMGKGKSNIRLTINFDPNARPSPEEIQKMQMYITLRNYSQYEDIVYYAHGRDVITSMNILADIAEQYNYCMKLHKKKADGWYDYDLVPC